MGNRQASGHEDFREKFAKKYDFTDLVEDDNFGPIRVHRKKQLNFDYVMVLQKYVSPTRIQILARNIERMHNAFLGPEQPMALRIFNFEVLKDSWSECGIPLVRLYIEYFNFTLHDLILRHKDHGSSFSYDQLVYIMDAVLKTYAFFSSIDQSQFMIHPKAVYLSTEGCIKFSPIKGEEFFQEENALCRAMLHDTHEKDLVNFERGKRFLLNEMKRLGGEVRVLSYRGEDGKECLELLQRIRNSNTLERMRGLIEAPRIDFLCLARKQDKIYESLATNPTSKTHKSISPTLSQHYSKLSLKKQTQSHHGSNQRKA